MATTHSRPGAIRLLCATRSGQTIANAVNRTNVSAVVTSARARSVRYEAAW